MPPLRPEGVRPHSFYVAQHAFPLRLLLVGDRQDAEPILSQLLEEGVGPRDVEGRNIYLCSPEYMANYVPQYVAAGVRLIGGLLRQKSHLLFTWLNELIRHPRILDAVEALLGPDAHR